MANYVCDFSALGRGTYFGYLDNSLLHIGRAARLAEQRDGGK